MDMILFENGNGGEVNLQNSYDIAITESIANQPYLAHFGGNKEASINTQRTNEEDISWWGNSFIDDTNQQMNSELERTLDNEALSSSGVAKIENSANKDIEYLQELGNATSKLSLNGNDKLTIKDEIKINNTVKYESIFKATQDLIIEERTL